MISIIIPTLNESSVIEGTVRQIHDHLSDFEHEIIVADSESADHTAAIAKKYAKVIETKRGKTIAWNKNQGAKIAKGDILVFLDADVFVPNPNHFFKIALSDFDRDPNLVAVAVNLKVFPKDATLADRIIFGWVNITNQLYDNFFHIGASCGECQIIRRDIFDRLRGYKEHLAVAEDHDMFMRLEKTGRVFFENRLTVFHTGRRAHIIGWPRLLLQWTVNYFSVLFFNRSHDKVWKDIR